MTQVQRDRKRRCPLLLFFVLMSVFLSGAVYLYQEISSGNWSLLSILSPGNPGDRFGASVVLDKFGRFAVGAPYLTSRGQGLFLGFCFGHRFVVLVYSISPSYSINNIATLESPFNPPMGNLRTGCALFGSDDIVNLVLIVGSCPTFSSLGTSQIVSILTSLLRCRDCVCQS
jgi:hypothetical protein